MPLALSRKRGQAIKIGENIVVTIGETRGSYTTVLVDAPKNIPVARIEGEVIDGDGSGSGKRAERRTGGNVLRRLPSAKGRGCATARAEAGESDGGDSSAADTAQRGSGAASDRESD